MHFRQVRLGEGGSLRQVSVLGFGAAAVMGRTGRADSLRAIHAALEAGINLFDTARSYGQGQSEALLGEVLQPCRKEIVLITKFGILPAPAKGWRRAVMPFAQTVAHSFPGLRKLRRVMHPDPAVFAPQPFTVELLHASLEASLHALRTDYVDALLMHCAPASAVQQDDLLAALQRLIEQGKILTAGISGGLDEARHAIAMHSRCLTTIAFPLPPGALPFTAETRTAGRDLFLVAHHPFGGPSGIRATLQHIRGLADSPALPAELRRELNVRDRQLLPEIVLNGVLSGTGITAVVPSMMHTAHLAANVRAVQHCRFSADELRLLSGRWPGNDPSPAI